MAADARIGTRIARRRHVLGMTQQQLATELGVAKSTVANWERGRHFPLRYLGKVEDVLGIELDPAEPPISPELRAMVDGLTPEQRAWVMDQLTAADRRLRRRENPEPDAPAHPRRQAAG